MGSSLHTSGGMVSAGFNATRRRIRSSVLGCVRSNDGTGTRRAGTGYIEIFPEPAGPLVQPAKR